MKKKFPFVGGNESLVEAELVRGTASGTPAERLVELPRKLLAVIQTPHEHVNER